MERVPGPIQASNMGESEIEPEMDGAGDGGEVSQGGREDFSALRISNEDTKRVRCTRGDRRQ